MITTRQLIEKFGNPMADAATFERNHMMILEVPAALRAHMRPVPGKIYINKVAAPLLIPTLEKIVAQGCASEIRTWDGCFNIRKQRGSNIISRHSYGIAIDMNATWNPLIRRVPAAQRTELRKKYVTWSEKFLDCWRSTGWVCGADWNTSLDGMHFEINEI